MTVSRSIPRDLAAGLVVFLVALPLCLGIAHASGAPLISGLVSGILAGVVVAWISGSATSVSGPAAGLTAVVLSQIQSLGSFEAFLVAVLIGGLLQIGLGVARAGFVAGYVPSGVIKGLLAAIGIILILKQVPHMVGHDPDPEGDMSFQQPDGRNTFTELLAIGDDFHIGAAVLGLMAFGILWAWGHTGLRKLLIPSPLVVVVLGVLGKIGFDQLGGRWEIGTDHLVNVPLASSLSEWGKALHFPDFSALGNPKVYVAAMTIAIVASLETLLNLEATDKLDPHRRNSPPSRELIAQGIGNTLAGLVGGLPMTSVIVRSSVNIAAGATSRLSAVFHGSLLLLSVVWAPGLLNQIPLSVLAAILVTTGLKLAPFKLFKDLWREGSTQFIPFMVTVVAIVLTDLLVGILIGLAVAIFFILRSNLKRPFRIIRERHLTNEVTRIELASQVSFLNRASLVETLEELPNGSHVLIDARNTDYIDPDVLDFLREFRRVTAPAKGHSVSLVGFKDEYHLSDEIQYVDVSTRDVQREMTPAQVLRVLEEGNERFVNNQRLHRDLARQVDATATGQFPLAVVLSCIDSRTSTELVFDLGLGDIFSIRIAGNVAADKVLASMEYACCVAGARLIVVLGHTACGAVTASCDIAAGRMKPPADCPHLGALTNRIARAVVAEETIVGDRHGGNRAFVDLVAARNVELTRDFVLAESAPIRQRVEAGTLGIVGAMYDVRSGRVNFIEPLPAAPRRTPSPSRATPAPGDTLDGLPAPA